MSVQLTQTEDARFAELDRKGRINQGVKVLLNRGSEGVWVGHAWAARPVTLHSRVMLRMVSGGEGQVVFLRGLGSDGLPRFSLDANPQARQITLRLPSGNEQVADLPWSIAWHCIEVGANSNTGVLRLWINGVLRCELNTYPPELEIAELRLGGFYKDYELTGEYHLADWRIEENYIGPVRKMVSGSALNDPARWLVVYNTSQADTCAWAEHYRELRQVPHANLCGLELTLDEVLDPQGYAEMDAAITAYLSDNGLLEQVKGLVLGLGVPGYVDFAGVLQPTTALLQRAGAVPGMVENAHFQAQGYTPLAAAEMGIDRLTARMDRHSFATAVTQMDRALELSAQGLGNGDASGLWLEPATNTTAGQLEWNQRLTAWTAGLARMRTRLPWHLPAEGQQFTQLQEDGFYLGFRPVAPSEAPTFLTGAPEEPGAGEPGEPGVPGARVLFMGLDAASATCTSLRQAGVEEWCSAALEVGYAAAIGASSPVTDDQLPAVESLMDALQQGACLGEAWHVAQPRLRGMLFLVGDPLMTVTFPQAGWWVLGPGLRAIDLKVDQPLAVLRENENSLVLPDGTPEVPEVPGAGALYVLHHLQEAGVREQGVYVRVVRDGSGRMQVVPRQPVWPDFEGWPVERVDGRLRLRLGWEVAPEAPETLLLWVDSFDTQQVMIPVAGPKVRVWQRGYEVTLDAPERATRYRWRLQCRGMDVWVSPWSAEVASVTGETPLLELENLEVGS